MIILEVPQSALFEVFESKSVQQGMKHDAPGAVTLQLDRMPMEKRHLPYVAAMATIFVTVGSGVAINLFSSCLYEKLKADKVGRAMGVTKIRINETEVEIDPDAIRRVIIRSIEIEHRN